MALREVGDAWGEQDLYDRLQADFGHIVDSATLREIAKDEVESFEFARIRDFIPLIAYRQARDRVIRQLRAMNLVAGAFRREEGRP